MRNYAHPALREAIIQFFYTGTYRIADKRPEEFRRSVTVPCLALVGVVVCQHFLYVYSHTLVLF